MVLGESPLLSAVLHLWCNISNLTKRYEDDNHVELCAGLWGFTNWWLGCGTSNLMVKMASEYQSTVVITAPQRVNELISTWVTPLYNSEKYNNVCFHWLNKLVNFLFRMVIQLVRRMSCSSLNVKSWGFFCFVLSFALETYAYLYWCNSAWCQKVVS